MNNQPEGNLMDQEKHHFKSGWGQEFTCELCGENLMAEQHIRLPRQSFAEVLASLAHVDRDTLGRSERHE